MLLVQNLDNLGLWMLIGGIGTIELLDVTGILYTNFWGGTLDRLTNQVVCGSNRVSPRPQNSAGTVSHDSQLI